MEFLFLGTGGSMGTPVVGCSCPVCLSKSPFDKRLRPSGLLTIGDKRILFDVTPDFRYQALKFGIDRLDGVIMTHPHYDHIGGLDELRTFYINDGVILPCLVSKETFFDIKSRYYYIFKTHNPMNSLTAKLDFDILSRDRGEVDFLGETFKYFSYFQGDVKVNGFRYKNFAYVTDIGNFPTSIFDDLKGVEILILSALRMEKSLIHLNFDFAIKFAQKVDAKKTYFMHMTHEIGHENGSKLLPEGIELAYDGLKLKLCGKISCE